MKWGLRILVMGLLGFTTSLNAQYDDTIQGYINIKYNHPRFFKFSALAGLCTETQTMEGGVFYPGAFADVHFRPVRYFMLHGGFKYQANFAWRQQEVKDVTGAEAGIRIFLSNRVAVKHKLFTAGNKAYNYDFFMPVNVGWSMGICADYSAGRATFNSGNDKQTALSFQRETGGNYKFENQFAVNYSYRIYSVGFVLSTAARLKGIAKLPTGVSKARRMKSFTEVRVEYLFGTTSDYDTLISIKTNTKPPAIHNYRVRVNETHNSGFRISGLFRRKLIGFKFEAGVKPGIYYRFSGSERPSVLDRSYFLLGFGLGWM